MRDGVLNRDDYESDEAYNIALEERRKMMLREDYETDEAYETALAKELADSYKANTAKIEAEWKAKETAEANLQIEIKADMHRNTRTNLLIETDVYALSDVVMSDDMKTYRQALRDLPNTTKDKWPNLEDSDWPTKPS